MSSAAQQTAASGGGGHAASTSAPLPRATASSSSGTHAIGASKGAAMHTRHSLPAAAAFSSPMWLGVRGSEGDTSGRPQRGGERVTNSNARTSPTFGQHGGEPTSSAVESVAFAHTEVDRAAPSARAGAQGSVDAPRSTGAEVQVARTYKFASARSELGQPVWTEPPNAYAAPPLSTLAAAAHEYDGNNESSSALRAAMLVVAPNAVDSTTSNALHGALLSKIEQLHTVRSRSHTLHSAHGKRRRSRPAFACSPPHPLQVLAASNKLLKSSQEAVYFAQQRTHIAESVLAAERTQHAEERQALQQKTAATISAAMHEVAQLKRVATETAELEAARAREHEQRQAEARKNAPPAEAQLHEAMLRHASEIHAMSQLMERERAAHEVSLQSVRAELSAVRARSGRGSVLGSDGPARPPSLAAITAVTANGGAGSASNTSANSSRRNSGYASATPAASRMPGAEARTLAGAPPHSGLTNSPPSPLPPPVSTGLAVHPAWPAGVPEQDAAALQTQLALARASLAEAQTTHAFEVSRLQGELDAARARHELELDAVQQAALTMAQHAASKINLLVVERAKEYMASVAVASAPDGASSSPVDARPLLQPAVLFSAEDGVTTLLVNGKTATCRFPFEAFNALLTGVDSILSQQGAWYRSQLQSAHALSSTQASASRLAAQALCEQQLAALRATHEAEVQQLAQEKTDMTARLHMVESELSHAQLTLRLAIARAEGAPGVSRSAGDAHPVRVDGEMVRAIHELQASYARRLADAEAGIAAVRKEAAAAAAEHAAALNSQRAAAAQVADRWLEASAHVLHDTATVVHNDLRAAVERLQQLCMNAQVRMAASAHGIVGGVGGRAARDVQARAFDSILHELHAAISDTLLGCLPRVHAQLDARCAEEQQRAALVRSSATPQPEPQDDAQTQTQDVDALLQAARNTQAGVVAQQSWERALAQKLAVHVTQSAAHAAETERRLAAQAADNARREAAMMEEQVRLAAQVEAQQAGTAGLVLRLQDLRIQMQQLVHGAARSWQRLLSIVGETDGDALSTHFALASPPEQSSIVASFARPAAATLAASSGSITQAFDAILVDAEAVSECGRCAAAAVTNLPSLSLSLLHTGEEGRRCRNPADDMAHTTLHVKCDDDVDKQVRAVLAALHEGVHSSAAATWVTNVAHGLVAYRRWCHNMVARNVAGTCAVDAVATVLHQLVSALDGEGGASSQLRPSFDSIVAAVTAVAHAIQGAHRSSTSVNSNSEAPAVSVPELILRVVDSGRALVRATQASHSAVQQAEQDARQAQDAVRAAEVETANVRAELAQKEALCTEALQRAAGLGRALQTLRAHVERTMVEQTKQWEQVQSRVTQVSARLPAAHSAALRAVTLVQVRAMGARGHVGDLEAALAARDARIMELETRAVDASAAAAEKMQSAVSNFSTMCQDASEQHARQVQDIMARQASMVTHLTSEHRNELDGMRSACAEEVAAAHADAASARTELETARRALQQERESLVSVQAELLRATRTLAALEAQIALLRTEQVTTNRTLLKATDGTPAAARSERSKVVEDSAEERSVLLRQYATEVEAVREQCRAQVATAWDEAERLQAAVHSSAHKMVATARARADAAEARAAGYEPLLEQLRAEVARVRAESVTTQHQLALLHDARVAQQLEWKNHAEVCPLLNALAHGVESAAQSRSDKPGSNSHGSSRPVGHNRHAKGPLVEHALELARAALAKPAPPPLADVPRPRPAVAAPALPAAELFPLAPRAPYPSLPPPATITPTSDGASSDGDEVHKQVSVSVPTHSALSLDLDAALLSELEAAADTLQTAHREQNANNNSSSSSSSSVTVPRATIPLLRDRVVRQLSKSAAAPAASGTRSRR
ncbi:MAG: hypothetical protein EOO41_00080 [Methanobacteriota archaeon]|nr:MAG: hypothetical protein EOO41_00080 [Euryarchaeota archaeon]